MKYFRAEFSKFSTNFVKYEESGMKINAKHYDGAGGSHTWPGVTTVPSSRVTGIPLQRSLKCNLGTSPLISFAFFGKNVLLDYPGTHM